MDHLSASQAGLRLIPAIVVSVIGSFSGGLVMQRTGRYYWLTVLAYTVLATAMLAIMLFSGVAVKSTHGIFASLVFVGLAYGATLTTNMTALIASASREDQATAIACGYLSRSLGNVVGLSLAATIVQQSLRLQLQAHLDQGKERESIVKNVRESLKYISTLEPGLQEIVIKCYGSATRHSFIFAFVLESGAMISSCKVMCAPFHDSFRSNRLILVFIHEKKLSPRSA